MPLPALWNTPVSSCAMGTMDRSTKDGGQYICQFVGHNLAEFAAVIVLSSARNHNGIQEPIGRRRRYLSTWGGLCVLLQPKLAREPSDVARQRA